MIATTTRARGFTMIELMCVVAIIALCLFLVVPNLDGLTPKTRLDASARRLASDMDLAQSIAIGQRGDTAVAYDLDHGTAQIIFPPKPVDPKPPDPNDPSTQPPFDDLEHGLAPSADEIAASAAAASGDKPATPAAPAAPNYEDREKLNEDPLPDDVQIVSVSQREGTIERTTGTVVVPFTPEGDDGSHVVLLRLKGPAGDAEGGKLWVRYDALTRSFEISETAITWSKIAGDSK